MSTPWRLIVHGAVDGALNMSIDRAIQTAREEGLVPPTVRLYRWARPTVTLGRFQSTGGVDRSACDSLAVDVVRRYTGGRGVLHDDELTYSVIASTEDGMPRGTTDSYAHLSAALIHAYQAMGIDAALGVRGRGDVGSSACYLQSTRADLSCGSAKLSGSAQVWLGSTVMQHGSFTRSRDVNREQRVFRLTTAQVAALSRSTIAIDDLHSPRIDLRSLISACIAGFETGLGLRLVRADLTGHEASYAAQLAALPFLDTPQRQAVS